MLLIMFANWLKVAYPILLVLGGLAKPKLSVLVLPRFFFSNRLDSIPVFGIDIAYGLSSACFDSF